jgi:hypothetical protein
VRARGRKCEAGGRSKETSAPNGIGPQGLHISDPSIYTRRATELSAEVRSKGQRVDEQSFADVGGSLQ